MSNQPLTGIYKDLPKNMERLKNWRSYQMRAKLTRLPLAFAIIMSVLFGLLIGGVSAYADTSAEIQLSVGTYDYAAHHTQTVWPLNEYFSYYLGDNIQLYSSDGAVSVYTIRRSSGVADSGLDFGPRYIWDAHGNHKRGWSDYMGLDFPVNGCSTTITTSPTWYFADFNPNTDAVIVEQHIWAGDEYSPLAVQYNFYDR